MKLQSAYLHLVAALAALLLPPALEAAVLVTSPISGSNPSATNPYTTDQQVDPAQPAQPRVTVSGIARGPGISANAGSNRFNATSWSTSAIDLSDYFTFTITPKAGFLIDYTSFVYTGERSGSGPNSFQFRSSRDNFTSPIGTPAASGATISLTGPSFQDIIGLVEFRLYAWGGAGTFSVNDFTFNGDIGTASVPEPQAIVLASFPMLGLLRLRSRRQNVCA